MADDKHWARSVDVRCETVAYHSLEPTTSLPHPLTNYWPASGNPVYKGIWFSVCGEEAVNVFFLSKTYGAIKKSTKQLLTK